MLFENPTLTALQKALDAGALRQRVNANNIANVNTPGFKKSTVKFDAFLRAALDDNPRGLAKTHARHMDAPGHGPDPQVVRVTDTRMRADGNNVDIEEEMIAQAANYLAYQTTSQLVTSRYAKLGMVISGGRR